MVKNSRILGHGNFLPFWPIFWPQWNPIGPKMDPKGSPPWFGAITINSICCPNRWPRGSQKFEFWGMVIIYGSDPFFCPNRTPLAPRCTLGGPHRDLAKKPWMRFFAQIDHRGVVKNSNLGAWQFFTVLTHFFVPMGPHWPQDGPQGFPTVIWRHNREFDFLPRSMTTE